MSFEVWQVSADSYDRVRKVISSKDEARFQGELNAPAVVFCSKPSGQSLYEVVAWVEEFGADCRVEAAGSFVFFEFAKESDAVAFKLRWYVR